jgi:3-methyl-2-oxobutanoate hydroxymethyltransferase
MSTTSTTKNGISKGRKKITTRSFRLKKKRGDKLTMLTAYDFPTALAIDNSEIDSILVGDSLGMVVLGYENTLPVTMEDMLHHCKAVSRGANYPLLVGDMPFMSYQVSVEQAITNAGRFLQEGGMDAIKLEGGVERAEAVKRIVEAGIPVMGHIGLTPQSINTLGGFRAQGKSPKAAQKLINDAIALEIAGAFSIVLESVPAQLAKLISEKLSIPTIGIGAGVDCDGQVLVTHDLVGQYDRFTPRFVKQYANMHALQTSAFSQYKEEVENQQFPEDQHSIFMKEALWQELQTAIREKK